jgi:hypothetical protein
MAAAHPIRRRLQFVAQVRSVGAAELKKVQSNLRTYRRRRNYLLLELKIGRIK